VAGQLTGTIALVAGATRGAGRAIATELGAEGATVYVTGRSTREQRSEMDRDETIEDAADQASGRAGRGNDRRDLAYNAKNYRISFFYDLAKTSVNRMAFALAEELTPHRAAAVSLTPGWMRSEIMLELFGVTEANWRDALAKEPHFAISESPAYVGRAVAALAADPEVARWNGRSLSSGELAQVYGFTDLDGSQPDVAVHRRGPRRRQTS